MPATRELDTPIDPHEAQALTAEGDLWQFKIEDNDCGLHLELAAPGAGRDAPQVIAEIPQGPAYKATPKAQPTVDRSRPRGDGLYLLASLIGSVALVVAERAQLRRGRFA